ncbi:hypothetical protein FRB98_007255 [Tulasnella sp. 332]|nr:hypothetical protein FRB98_007255 [Tulasnella sp. 332]
MTSTSPVPAQDVINSAFGPFVTGIMLQMLLMGVIVVLVWDYYVITRIVRLSFTTSALTAAIAVINVILYMALPSSEAYDLLPQLVMGKLYVISCMITLASRSELRNVLDSTENSSYVAEEACSRTPSGQTVSTKIEVPALPRHLRTQTHIAHITTTLPIPIPTSTSTSPTPTPSLTPKSSMTMMKPKPVRPGIMIRTTSFTRSDTGEVLPAPVPDVPKSQSEYRRDRHRDSDDIVLDRVHTINDGNEVFETAIQFPPLPVRTAADASTEELQSQFRGRSLTFSRLGRMA